MRSTWVLCTATANGLKRLGRTVGRLDEGFHQSFQSILLENLVIQVANGVVQPLLNCFPHHESVKQRFYRRNLLSTRETERLRNQLSQRYRWQRYWDEPRAIFVSCCRPRGRGCWRCRPW